MPSGKKLIRTRRSFMRTARAQQGTGINRAPISLGTLTPEQCDKAVKVVCGRADDAADARHLMDVLGLLSADVDDVPGKADADDA